MYTRILIFSSVILVLLACSSQHRAVSEKSASSSGWDLSYSSIMRENHVGSEDWFNKWLDRSKAPSRETLLNLAMDAEGAILLEYPAFHAGERLTFLFAQTKHGAFCWSFVEGKPYEIAKPVDTTSLDLLVKQVSTWQQEPPQDEEVIQGFRGYFAVISVRQPNISKQILLNLQDFKILTDPNEVGRVYKTFAPVIKLPD